MARRSAIGGVLEGLEGGQRFVENEQQLALRDKQIAELDRQEQKRAAISKIDMKDTPSMLAGMKNVAQQYGDPEAYMKYAGEEDARAKQAKIDALMLEYCPDEMSPSQVKDWGDNQQPVPADIDAAVHAASGKPKECQHEWIRAPQVADGLVCHKCGEPQQAASGESPPVITPQEAALLPDTDAGRSNGPVAQLEQLLGEYWALAYKEGASGISQGDAANKALHDLRKLYAADPSTINVKKEKST